ncbi:MAG TPA: hypothetical protein VHZ29_05040 [Rhizomicrobium sp.]|jgi:hypothetical protein|nr:hypothetical protein [Rhizomicrobium sp.]
MKRLLILIVACITSLPSIAGVRLQEGRNDPLQWQAIGSVTISHRQNFLPEIFHDFEGRKPEKIGLLPTKHAIDCKNILLTYQNGTTSHIGESFLPDDRVAYVELPADAGTLSSLMLQCRGDYDTVVRILANRDRSEAKGWQKLGNSRTGGGGVLVSLPFKVKSIGLMPLETDARCTSAKLFLLDGQTQMLEIPPLTANRITAVDLPLGGIKLRKIDFNCESENPLMHRFHLEAFARYVAD